MDKQVIDWDLITARLRHLIEVERLGSTRTIRKARTIRALIAIGSDAITPLLASFPEIRLMPGWEALRSMIGQSEGNSVSIPMRAFDSVPPEDTADQKKNSHIDWLFQRLIYLLDEEFDNVCDLEPSQAMYEMRNSPVSASYFLRIFLNTENANAKRLARYASRICADVEDDAWWTRCVHDQLRLTPNILDVPEENIRQFRAAGLVSSDFEERRRANFRCYSIVEQEWTTVTTTFPGARVFSEPHYSSVQVGRDHLNKCVLVTYCAERMPEDGLMHSDPRSRDGIAKLRFCGRSNRYFWDDETEDSAYLLVEECPRGVRSDVHAPGLSSSFRVKMAMSVAEIVAGIHREGETLIGIRPELVFVESDARVTIAPRAERLLTAGTTQCYPFDTAYAAPEVYEGHPSTVESDIYSFCATIAFWSQGRHPFGRSTLQVQYRAAMHEVPDCDGVEEPLRSLIMIGLSPEPSRRPKLESIVGMLSLMSSSGGN